MNLRAIIEENGGKFCEDCGCCEMLFEGCGQCGGEGWVEEPAWDYCGEDEDVRCPTCEGKGGWYFCGCPNDRAPAALDGGK